MTDIIDLTTAMDNDGGDDDDEDGSVDYSTLDADGKTWDLTNADEVRELQDKIHQHREDLRNADFKTYEDYPTYYGGGGRSRLLHDQIVCDLAADYHKGDNNYTWEEMHVEADETVSIVAAKTRHKWVK